MEETRLEILMVRHAHAEWVPDESRPLSARGHRDAQQVAVELLARQSRPTAIYSSPLPRSVQTVEPLASALGLSIEIVEDLRERTLADGPVDDFPAAMRASWEDLTLTFPGGESSLAALERFSTAVDSIVSLHSEGSVAIGTHGNVLGLWLQDKDPSYDYETWCGMSWPDLYRVRLDDGDVDSIERIWSGGLTFEEL